MFLVRFCYELLPADRNEVIELVRKEVEAASAAGFKARLLVPLTRGQGDPALEYELEVPDLDSVEAFREQAIGADQETTHEWMRRLSQLLTRPPSVTIYRVDDET